MNSILCIYHGNCADGFTAAWAVHKNLPSTLPVDFVAGIYGEEPPDVTGRTVIMVDFSYKRDVLLELASKAERILVLDHHESAMKELGGFPTVESLEQYQETVPHVVEPGNCPIHVLFDMKRSGAGISWDFFSESEKDRPALVDYVEDRDLWRFSLLGSREVNAAIFAHDYTFEQWDKLCRDIEDDVFSVQRAGAAILRKQDKDVRELVAASKRRMTIGGFDVPVACLPYTLASDACHLMLEGEVFSACYMDMPRGRVFSLRSADNGPNVADIARAYGGGGHPHAAGFTMPLGWEGDAA